MTEPSRPRLLVAKGSFESMGGAERDLIRVLPAINRLFEVTMATIQPSIELEEACSENGIQMIIPQSKWHLSTDPISIVMDSGRGTASKAWASCTGLPEAMASSIALHLVSGDGSLPILDHVPPGLRVHLHLLEPHRGLYEETLHRRVDGSPRRNLALTKAALSRARSRDQSLMDSLMSREGAIVSGNSRFSAQRANEVYGIEAGVLWPCVDTSEFPEDPSDDPENPYPDEEEYVVSVGRASYAKGTWETISMLAGTGLSLAHVGGGDEGSLGMLRKHADSRGVGLWVAPRLPSPDLVSLMRGARAIVSMAHKESFGLTPIEAFAVGTPPLFVDEGGFRDTIVDGENGRLLDRVDDASWHSALEQASDPSTREIWAASGRARISELDLTPDAHARRIWDLLANA
jgi:glycosyltransferase involved in cell wall biosynthesis